MIYLDTSALVKLVVEEAETAALRRFVAQADPRKLVTSALSRAELLRAAQRRDEPTVRKAREVLDGLAEITITEALLDSAGARQSSTLRTLDAIHLATAMELGAELSVLVAYDARLLGAARGASVPTLTPL
jgi:predicted nucleic acid-binding protein